MIPLFMHPVKQRLRVYFLRSTRKFLPYRLVISMRVRRIKMSRKQCLGRRQTHPNTVNCAERCHEEGITELYQCHWNKEDHASVLQNNHKFVGSRIAITWNQSKSKFTTGFRSSGTMKVWCVGEGGFREVA